MNEEFLYYLWKFRLFKQDIKTSTDEEIRIISPGVRNCDSGPDFINARVRIGNTLWAGNVEIHVKASDWFRHRHDTDPCYDNIILHVVYDCDAYIKRRSNEIIPSFEVKECFDISLLSRYEQFISSMLWVPCENMIKDVDAQYLNIWMERLIVERLERKSEEVEKVLRDVNGDWEQAFFQLLARSFGFNVNSYPFELLAKSIPLKLLAKHCDELFQIEALLFGQAGFLNTEFKDEYPRKLKAEYNYLLKKYSLNIGDRFLWKFLRLRPSNFPTVRIAQLSKLVYNSPTLFTSILESLNLSMIFKLFDVKPSSYWDTHYRFDCGSSKKQKKIGKDALRLFIINTVVPALFYYGKLNDISMYSDRALDFLSHLKPEKNAVIKRWEKHGINPDSASQSQALLELKTQYCDHKKCLLCGVGNYLIRQ